MSPANSEFYFLPSLDSPPPFFFSFFYSLNIGSPSQRNQIEKWWEWASCLVPNLRGTCFQLFTIEYGVGCVFVIMAFIMLIYVPSIPTLLVGFMINGLWILSKAFSAFIEMIWFLFFSLVTWYARLICRYWTIFASLG